MCGVLRDDARDRTADSHTLPAASEGLDSAFLCPRASTAGTGAGLGAGIGHYEACQGHAQWFLLWSCGQVRSGSGDGVFGSGTHGA